MIRCGPSLAFGNQGRCTLHVVSTEDVKRRRLSRSERAAWVGAVQTVERVLREIDTAFRAACGVTLAEGELLFLLTLEPEPQRVLDLTRLVLMSQSSVSRTLGRLEAKGLVTREVSSVDARATLVAITDPGRRLDHDLRQIEEEVVQERVFARLDASASEALEGIWAGLGWITADPVYAAIVRWGDPSRERSVQGALPDPI